MAKGLGSWLLALAVIVVVSVVSIWGTGSGIILLFILGPPLLGCFLALVLPVRERWLLTPVLLLAFGYWIYGWFGDAYDIGRTGLVVLTGLIGAAFFLSWFVGVRIGRSVRRNRASRRPSGQPEGPQCSS